MSLSAPAVLRGKSEPHASQKRRLPIATIVTALVLLMQEIEKTVEKF
jgi:hypothetical protein